MEKIATAHFNHSTGGSHTHLKAENKGVIVCAFLFKDFSWVQEASKFPFPFCFQSYAVMSNFFPFVSSKVFPKIERMKKTPTLTELEALQKIDGGSVWSKSSAMMGNHTEEHFYLTLMELCISSLV